MEKLIKALRLAGIGLAALAVAACQDYGFEESPSSVIHQSRTDIKIGIAAYVDLLFVVDGSGSMVGEQLSLSESFKQMVARLDAKFGAGKFRIAIITPGVESPGCPACNKTITSSCMNNTGESGRFQDRLGKITDPNANPPAFSFRDDSTCRVMDSTNIDRCFFNTSTREGAVLVGVTGCGYERGLASIRAALSGNLLSTWNQGFLRDNATLGIILISDEEDCGEVGDVKENTPSGGKICYYASKGQSPDGNKNGPDGKPYGLTPVKEYYDFLKGLKNNRENQVKFVAIVGVKDKDNPTTTIIEFAGNLPTSDTKFACKTPGCTGENCDAYPGTRYIQLASMFGPKNGLVDTICQSDFSTTMGKIGEFVSCPTDFVLSEPIRDPALANILLNDEAIPRYFCKTAALPVKPCLNPEDETTCPAGQKCDATWFYDPPTALAPGGTLRFNENYDPCKLFANDQTITELKITISYVTK